MLDDPIVSFYSGGTDDRGRTLERILAWRDEELEAAHDYIQWVFPTLSRSAVNPSAPLVRDATRAAFAARPELRTALRQSLDRMLAFYGFRRSGDHNSHVRVDIDKSSFADRARVWLHPGNHNHLRLTRIMQSLAALGLPAEAEALQRCLADVYKGPGRTRITIDTYQYWMDALRS
jgi:hypothetical protein